MSLKKLNKTQISAVEAIDGPVLIFAGAGSGKTRVLTHKLFHLVKEGLFKPEEILEFRDKSYKNYHTYKPFLSRIDKKFGKKAIDNIKDMTKITLKRKILGHSRWKKLMI